MNTMKLAIMSLMFSTNSLISNNHIQPEVTFNINWGNAAKVAILSTTSLASIVAYYNHIKPHLIELAQEKGLMHAITDYKNFILANPKIAAINAIPLFLGIFHAILARDYAQKIVTKEDMNIILLSDTLSSYPAQKF